MAGKSEMRKLLERIDSENFAMELVSRGLVEGVARHKFISARYRQIGRLSDRLERIVGSEEAAIDLVAKTMQGGVAQ